MKKLGIVLLLFSQTLFAQTVVPLSNINLDQVSDEYRPLIFANEKFRIGLMNGFCESNKSEVNVSRDDISRNLDFYQQAIPELLMKFESLLQVLKPGFFAENPGFYPLNIDLSLDGNEDCYNATAEGNHIELPAQTRHDYMRAVYDLLYHEIGHAMSYFNGEDQNIFDETIADAISLLLLDPSGIFYLGMKEEREEWGRRIELGRKDPHALAAEVGIEYSNVPLWLKENELKYRCSSNEFYRDLRSQFSLSEAFEGGGESYIVSCAFHSYLRRLGQVWGHEAVLKTFVKTYLLNPATFNELDIPRILTFMFPGIDHRSFDPGLQRLILRKGDGKLRTTISSFNDEDGNHFRLRWNNSNSDQDLSMVAFKDSTGTSLASFSILNRDKMLVLTPRDSKTCKEEKLVCYCPDEKNTLGLQVAWMTNDGSRTSEKAIKLPFNEKGCFEFTVPENVKTK